MRFPTRACATRRRVETVLDHYSILKEHLHVTFTVISRSLLHNNLQKDLRQNEE